MDYYIYKIVCKDPLITDIYVGSTINYIVRKRNHKTSCNNPINKSYNMRVYQYIRNNGGWENWEFIIIETIFCNNKKEALLLEKKWILELNATLNKQVPTRTDAEYYEVHKDKIKDQVRLYQLHHKEQIKEYLEINKLKIKERHQEYFQKNKERHNELQRERRRNNPK